MRGTRLTFDLVSDACVPRRMILDHSTWRPGGESDPIPERRASRGGSWRHYIKISRCAARSSIPRSNCKNTVYMLLEKLKTLRRREREHPADQRQIHTVLAVIG